MTLDVDTDSVDLDALASDAQIFDALAVPNSIYRTSVSGGSLSDSANITLEIAIPADQAASASSGSVLQAMVRRVDTTDDGDKSEQHEQYDAIESVYSEDTGKLTVAIPGYLFPSDGTLSTALVAVATSGVKTAPSVAASVAANSMCPINSNSLAMPIDPWSSYTDPQLGFPVGQYLTAGVFGEPRAKDGTAAASASFAASMADNGHPLELAVYAGHGGWDLVATSGTPLHAPADGNIIQIKRQDYDCANPPMQHSGRKPIYSLIMELDNNLGRVAFRHLTYGSVVTALNNIGIATQSSMETCWTGTRHVQGGQVIGQTGATGTEDSSGQPHPHLHLEWAPHRVNVDDLPKRRNPICAFGNLGYNLLPGSTSLQYSFDTFIGLARPSAASSPGHVYAGDEMYVKRRPPPASTPLFTSMTYAGGAYYKVIEPPNYPNRFPDILNRGNVIQGFSTTTLSGPITTVAASAQRFPGGIVFGQAQPPTDQPISFLVQSLDFTQQCSSMNIGDSVTSYFSLQFLLPADYRRFETPYAVSPYDPIPIELDKVNGIAGPVCTVSIYPPTVPSQGIRVEAAALTRTLR